MPESTIRLEGVVARLETRRSKRGARLAFMWLCVDGVDGVRPVVVFPPAYEPLAGKIGIGSRVRVEGTHGAGEYPEAIYADHISLAK